MEKISFKNFRKYKEFPELDLKGVTILVGENSSGKSTFTKGLLLLVNYITSNVKRYGAFDFVECEGESVPSALPFSFKDSSFKHIFIDTFYQALCNKADKGEIEFSCAIDEYEISVFVSLPPSLAFGKEWEEFKQIYGDSYDYGVFLENYPKYRKETPEYYKNQIDKDEAAIRIISINDTQKHLCYTINFELLSITVEASALSDEEWTRLCELKKNFGELYPDDAEYEELKSEIKSLEQKRIVASPEFWGPSKPNTPYALLKYSVDMIAESKVWPQRITPTLSDIETRDFVDSVQKSYDRLNHILKDLYVDYIYAHSVHQLSSYRLNNDADEYMDRIINDYYMQSNSETDKLVQGWMRQFKLGDRVMLKKDKNGYLEVSVGNGVDEELLSAKGIGTIQLVLMFFKLALFVCRKESHKIMLIEEPEQNLHPALQSELTQLFVDIHNKYGCQFVIETHSEYIVRRSQLIVNELGCDACQPFALYYFSKDGSPRFIGYDKDGSLTDQFDDGFYNVAEDINYKLLTSSLI